MNFHPLPDNWEQQRLVAQRLATHVLGQARFRHDGLFDLVPLPGGFGTPPVGPQRERVRLVGGSMFIERVVGDRMQFGGFGPVRAGPSQYSPTQV